ncbi:MAG: hypothetical protein N2517_08325, partial [Ignavibacteria bacterium]|nr:hypothetical protein [Ignavibacteria bacterium]
MKRGEFLYKKRRGQGSKEAIFSGKISRFKSNYGRITTHIKSRTCRISFLSLNRTMVGLQQLY